MPGKHAAPRASRSTAPGRRFGRRFITSTTVGALALGTVLTLSVPAEARTPMYLGSVDGGHAQMQSNTGETVANHAYAPFSSKPPTARMITVHAGSARFSQVANAGPGTPLYNDIVRWAQTIKARGGRIMLAYNHEPEAAAGGNKGTPAEFIAAWRRVVTIFRQQGVANVEWTWQMTAYAFRARSSDPRSAARWYPGNAWVDNIGADAYNWYTCGEGSGRYNELAFLGDPVLAFARARGKPASFPEFASHATANRSQWIRNAHQYFLAHQDILTAAFYFNRPPTVNANNDCVWALRTSAEFDAFGDIVRDRQHFTA